MSTLRWSVIVPVRNKAAVLSAALGSIVEALAGRSDAELIIVDHGSTDGSSELLRAIAPTARIVPLDIGTAALARNRGAAAATGVFLCFIDADVRVPADYFDRLAAVLEETGADAVGCTVTVPRLEGWIAMTWDRLHAPRSDGWRGWLAAANFSVRRDAFERVGGFAERLVTGEDAELCVRLTAAGVRIFEALRLQAEHLDNPASLGAFFRKEHWRGLGMLGTVRRERLDRPTAMTIMHALLLASAIGVAVQASPIQAAAIVPALAFAAPGLTVAYRRMNNRVSAPILQSLVLYQLYYLARLAALARLTLSGVRQRHPVP
jgi:cellulose synthase/poly-beta-1,6-N-acetylglucosamine synthase-like glycosyltransferase